MVGRNIAWAEVETSCPDLFGFLNATELVCVVRTCRDWSKSFRRRSLRQLRARELICEKVGPEPFHKSWKEEWKALECERGDSMIHFDECLRYVMPSAEWKYSRGWKTHEADGYTLLMTKFKAVLGESMRKGETRFAASCHLIAGVLNRRAREEGVAPAAFNDLDGPYGLRRADKAWGALRSAEIGYTFKTTTPIEASAASQCLTPAGFSAPIIDVQGDTEDVQYQAQDSDIVCFVSRPEDPTTGFQSLVHTASTQFEEQYDLPPLSKVTLIKISEPNEWTAPFHPHFRVNRRLYTVQVSFL